MAMSAFAIDMILPLFDFMADSLGSPLEKMPLTISIYFLSMGLGQFVFGTCSDKWGRKPVLMVGMALFISGAVVAGSAHSLEILLFGRVIQGFGAAAIHILSRAIIRDLYDGVELAKKMAIAAGIFSIGPIVAPLIGAGLAEFGGSWRWVFVFIVVACLVLFWFLVGVKESNKHKNPNALRPARLLASFKTVWSHPQSRNFLVVSATITVSIVLILTTTPNIYSVHFDISGTLFALYFAMHGFGIIIGQLINHRLIGVIGVVRTSMVACVIMMVSALSIVICAATGTCSPLSIALSLTLFAVGFLSVVANSASLTLQPHASIVGFTTALLGTSSQLFSGVIGSAVAPFLLDSILVWGLAVGVTPAIVLLILIRWDRKQTAFDL